ncbi:MAG TPA: transcription termination factor NusA [candidate division Zixibacteria bacterium]|nr:transcription termination factor NusA [candidate division Zixibacteria bacterium]
MNYDILETLTQIAREKNIELDYVVETLESALVQAAKKKFGEDQNIVAKVDRASGEISVHVVKTVVKKVKDENTEVSLKEAQEIDERAEPGDEVEVYIGFEEFGRNAIALAKQLMIQKVREAEREIIYEEYSQKIGELISGSVQQVDKGNIIVNLGRTEGIMPISQQISREKYRQGDRIRAVIHDVQRNQRGHQIVLSRAQESFLQRLFELEVPEIFERIIEIKAIAREPGERSKIAVSSADDRIDPVGACVGVKGVRVQSIVRELNNERIDIIQYHPDPEIFVTRALSPAKVVRIDTFPEDQEMTVVVEDEKLSLAIGRQGQNARLASKLTGWKINIMSENEFSAMKRFEAENYLPISHLPGLGDIMINRLMDAGFMYAQDLVNADMEKLTEVEGIGPKKAQTLIETAKIQVAEFEERRRQELEAAQAEGETDEEYEEEDVVGEPDSEEETSEVSDIEEATVEHVDEQPQEEETEEAVDEVVQEGVAPDTEELDAPDWEEESEKENQ